MIVAVNKHNLDDALAAIKSHRQANPDKANEVCWAFACDDKGEPLLKVSHNPVDNTYILESFGE